MRPSSKHPLRRQSSVLDNGIIEVTELQNNGYTYITVTLQPSLIYSQAGEPGAEDDDINA